MFDTSCIGDLEEMPPGPELAAVLASIDIDRLDGYDRVVVLKAEARQLAYQQARFYRAVGSVGRAVCEKLNQPGWDGFEFAADELRPALRWTRRGAERHLEFAWWLLDHLPEVWDALESGRIDLARAHVLVDYLAQVDPDIRTRVLERVLVRAGGWTCGELAAALRRALLSIDAELVHQQYQKGLARRSVQILPNHDGTATLYGFNLPADRANAALDRIEALAEQARHPGDTRTIDEVRADVFLDLLEGRHLSRRDRRGVVDIRVDLETLLGLANNPAEIPGWGPVIDEIARLVAIKDDHQWRVTVTQPQTGDVLAVGLVRRRPTAAQRRRIEAERPTCTFPGCRVPASRSDLDHTVPFAEGGETGEENLGPACRHDHRLRHRGGWRLAHTHPHLYTWTSPLGHKYVVNAQGP